MIKRFSLILCTVAAGLGAAIAPAQAQSDRLIGEIMMVGFNFCPEDTLPADGRLLPINNHQALFSLYGTRFGGDGRSNFALPDLTGITDVKGNPIRHCVVIYANFPIRGR